MLINIFVERKQMRIIDNQGFLMHAEMNATYTQIVFVPKILSHKFYIRVDNPLEMIKILSYIDDNMVLKGIMTQILTMMPNINDNVICDTFGLLSVVLGRQIPARYFKQVLDSVSGTDKKVVKMLYAETRKG